MKSRSNRLPTSDPPDDWVNGSWVVDCICGVNFDDGEEMVNCDECGVWVHTRCSRYVKGEKSFACDKCKNKSSRNNSEETEVAQLLVELPTKTIKMNSNPYPLNNLPWPPYRPWNDRPIEERVHVQGVPGGDPSLFQGFSSIFNSELWKCTGYVPKKFNFRYREFPCWDQEEGDVDAKADGDTENVVNKGAGVLYSLSKETFGGSRAPGFVSMKGQVKAGGSDKKVSKEWKLEGSDLKNSHLQNSTKKEKLRSPLPQCVKRSREDPGPSKDHCLKKKNRTVQKEHDKKDKVHTFKTVVIHSPNARQAEVIDAKAHKAAEFDAIDNRLEHGKDTECKVLTSTAQKSMDGCVEKPKRNAAIDQEDLTPRSGESAGFGYSSHKRVKTERLANDASDTAKSEEISSPSLAKDASVRDVGKKETQLHDSDRNQGAQLETAASDLPEAKPRNEIVTKSAVEVQDTEDPQNLDVTAQLSPTYCNSKTKLSVNVDDVKDVSRSYPSDHVAKSDFVKGLVEQVQSTDHDVNFKVNGAGPTTSQSPEHEGKGAGGDLKSAGICKVEKDDKIGGDSYDNRAKSDGLESSTGIAKFSSESKEVAKGSGDSKNLAGTTPASPPRQRKIVSAGKSSLGSSTIVLAKYSLADRNRTGISQSSSLVGKEMMSNSSVESKKESEPVDSLKGQGKHDKSKSTVKANLKSSVGSVTKSSQASKPGNSAVFKHYTSVGKDSLRHVSSKSSSVEGASRLVDIAEPASLPTQHTVHGQSKNTASAGQQRGEKASQSHSQLPSKSTQSASGHLATSSSPAGLSDEELALLLHQELNSSPRVPRVPRVRQTGSLPQLSSASATSMLIKRTSSSGGKEHHTFSRRKGKDVHKDGPRSSHERDIETRKGDRVSSPSDSAKTSDALPSVAAKQETLHSAKKNAEQISTNSGRSSVDANEVKISSSRDSPVNTSDHDTTISKGHGSSTHRTLPGLIAEIMGKGRRMTYEELCNAVLPHWPNLRKHNGERYAYSSHSQAVLDCLRNRTEWAQLVDRGPKTNASRKKRKLDSEAMSTESEDGEGKSVESRKEEFPKGRRKARKGRRLTLRGRSVKSDRRRKLEAGSDHTGSFSDSGEETESSEDGSHGSGLCAARSSDEVGAVS